jgi:predicted O-methyltransferase YrrM
MAGNDREFLASVFKALAETERHGLAADCVTDSLSGLSGEKTVGALQRLARLFEGDATACYLEIGVFQGLTLVSTALAAPRLPCFGVDNFATLDPAGENKRIATSRIREFGANNATLIDSDFEAALGRLDVLLSGRKIGVYFVDGPHDYRSQMVCLLAAKRYLHDGAVIVVDDANYVDVRRANRDFLISHPEFKLLFEAYTPAHPANMTAIEKAGAEQGWLNGINVIVRDPDGLLPEMLPPVDDDRRLYFNEWLVHRLRLAELAPEAVVLADAIVSGDKAAEKKARQALTDRHATLKVSSDKRFADRNTYSKGLTEARFNMFRG